MKPPKKPSHPTSDEENLERFEQELQFVDRALAALKERYNQVQADKTRQKELQHRLKESRYVKLPEMKAELRRIQQELEGLELKLESQLFSWNSLKEPFWLAVRFGGLGVIIGWLLK